MKRPNKLFLTFMMLSALSILTLQTAIADTNGLCDAGIPNVCECGEVITTNGIYQLTILDTVTTASCTGDGLVISGSNKVIDCAGRTITHGNGGTGRGFRMSTFDGTNINITNCILNSVGGNSNQANIEFSNRFHNSTITNNVMSSATSTYTIYIADGKGMKITNNNITSQGTAIAFENVNGGGQTNTIQNNRISTANIGIDTGIGINNDQIKNNIITSTTNQAILVQANNTIIEGNNITNTGASGIGIHITSNRYNNILLNNRLNSTAANEIQSDSAQKNYLIYNNTFGQIKWIGNSFLTNLDVNGRMILGDTIKISQNYAGINTTAFNAGINSSANITLKNTNKNNGSLQVYAIFKDNNYDGTLDTQCISCNVTNKNLDNYSITVPSFSAYGIKIGNITTITTITTVNTTKTVPSEIFDAGMFSLDTMSRKIAVIASVAILIFAFLMFMFIKKKLE